MFTKEADVHAVYGPLFDSACIELRKTAEHDPDDVRAGLYAAMGNAAIGHLGAGIGAGVGSRKGYGPPAAIGGVVGSHAGEAVGAAIGRRIGAPHFATSLGGFLGAGAGGYSAHRMLRQANGETAEKSKYEKGTEKAAAVAAFVEKVARVFGESEPRISDAEIPYEVRKAQLLNYAKKKAKEEQTPLGTALATGGGIGAGIGALGGAISSGLGGAARGAAGGAVGGALIGALMKGRDNLAIYHAKRLLRPDADLDSEMADRVVRQKRNQEFNRYMNEERRHRELLSSNRGRYY